MFLSAVLFSPISQEIPLRTCLTVLRILHNLPLNEQKNTRIITGTFTKGDGCLKQVLLSMAAVMLAALIFAGMVLYTISVIRAAELRILTGEMAAMIAGYPQTPESTLMLSGGIVCKMTEIAEKLQIMVVFFKKV